jgi:hypothetical protein
VRRRAFLQIAGLAALGTATGVSLVEPTTLGPEHLVSMWNLSWGPDTAHLIYPKYGRSPAQGALEPITRLEWCKQVYNRLYEHIRDH